MFCFAHYYPLLTFFLRLIGFEVSESHNLKPHAGVFGRLRVLDLRVVRQLDPWEEDEPGMDAQV